MSTFHQNLAAINQSVTTVLSNTNDPSRWFSKEDGLLVADLASHVAALGTIRVGYDQRLYRFDHGVYRPDGDLFARMTVKDLLGYKVKKRHFDEVQAWLLADLPFIPAQPPTSCINVRNGLFDWRSGVLHPHDPDVPSAVQLPVEWHPTATSPVIDRFLADVLPADAIEQALEVIGYAAYAGNPLSKAVMLLGPGGNGKSQLLNMIKALLGTTNVSAVSLHAIAENRFAVAELAGKLANICGDLDARTIKRTDHFKQLTGGDPVTAERKFGQPFAFTSFALPMFSANEAPSTSDQTEAYFDRWIILPMEHRIRGTSHDDPHILSKITTTGELEGLLVQAMAGLGRLMARGRFAPARSVSAAGDNYRDRLDSIGTFVGETCRLDPVDWTPRTALYLSYKRWCTDNRRDALAPETVYENLRRDFGVRDGGRNGVRGLRGIGHRAA